MDVKTSNVRKEFVAKSASCYIYIYHVLPYTMYFRPLYVLQLLAKGGN